MKQPEKIFVLSLARRSDRREKALAECARVGLSNVEVFEGLDGHALEGALPDGVSAGMHGCLAGHQRILEQCVLQKVQSVLVLEDDVVFCDDFKERWPDTLQKLPPDTDMFYLGGQFKEPPAIQGEFLRAVGGGIIRTHSYVVCNHEHLRKLYVQCCSFLGHVDNIFSAHHAASKVLAPMNWLCGQSSGVSDVKAKSTKVAERWWEQKRILRTGHRMTRPPCRTCDKRPATKPS